MPLIGEYAKRFGVYDELPNYLSYALGAGETTVMRMVTAYSMFANGRPSREVDADRPHPGPLRPHHLQARRARMPWLRCLRWLKNQPEPQLVDRREQVLDAMTAYQITSMMEGVVQRGTAASAFSGFGSRSLARPAQRTTKGRLVHRVLARHRGRHLYRL